MSLNAKCLLRKLFPILLVLSLFSCNYESNFIVKKTGSDELLIGYTNTTVILDKTVKNKIPGFKQLKLDGLTISFSLDSIITAVVFSNHNFELHTGIKIGSTRDEIVATYGKPIVENPTLSKGDTPFGYIEGLFYRKAYFFLDRTGKAYSIGLCDQVKHPD